MTLDLSEKKTQEYQDKTSVSHPLNLSTERLELFKKNLTNCVIECEFDQDFVKNTSIEALSQYSIQDWLRLFKTRLKALQRTDFDWTRINLKSPQNWAKSNKHTNYHWLGLASDLAKLSGLHISEIIFPDVDISDKDRTQFINAKSFAALYYNDAFDRLMSVERIVKYAIDKDAKITSYNTKGEQYPLSLSEGVQIQDKIFSIHLSEHQYVEINWHYFQTHFIQAWERQRPSSDFSDLVYPLFDLVTAYFSGLERGESSEQVQKLLQQFYDEEVRHLTGVEANFFYGQRIPLAYGDIGKNGESVFLYDIFLKLMRAKDLASVTREMTMLAVWITLQNPQKLIQHDLVDQCYRELKLGRYFTYECLSDELAKLLRYRSSLSDEDIAAIQQIGHGWYETESQNDRVQNEAMLFEKIFKVFKLREQHNQYETFMNTKMFKINSFQYVHYRLGANAQYIRIAQFLAGWDGFLERHGIEDYFQLLMPDLQSPRDSVTGDLLSTHPLSHYARPRKNSNYLAYLGNSLNSYHLNRKCFYDVNKEHAGAFSPSTYADIQEYAAEKYRGIERIPKFTTYKLRASTLKALVDLVNESLHYDGLEENDGYKLEEGFSHFHIGAQERKIAYEVDGDGIEYKTRDFWADDLNGESSNSKLILTDRIVFANHAEKRAFLRFSTQQRLTFILSVAAEKGYVRPNFSIAKYANAYLAYSKFRQFYLELDPSERERLNNVSMRLGGTVRTFEEIWANGFPDCMSSSSNWFSTLILDYLPQIKFRIDIENYPKYSKYLFYARRDSQSLWQRDCIHDDVAKIKDINDLVQCLTHISSQNSFAGIVAKGLYLFGALDDYVSPLFKELLQITDSSRVSQHSMFKKTRASVLRNVQHKFQFEEDGSTSSEDDSNRASPKSVTPVKGAIVSIMTEEAFNKHLVFGKNTGRENSDSDSTHSLSSECNTSSYSSGSF